MAKDAGSGEVSKEGPEKAAGTPTNNPSEKTINDEKRKQSDDPVEDEVRTNESVGAKDGEGGEDIITEKVAGTPTNPSKKPFSEEERNQQGDTLEKEDRTNESAGAKDGLGEDKDSTDEATAMPLNLNPSKAESAKVGSGNEDEDGTEKYKADGTPMNPYRSRL